MSVALHGWLFFAVVVAGLLGVWWVADWGVDRLICALRGHDDVRRVQGRTLHLECVRCLRVTVGVTTPRAVLRFQARPDWAREPRAWR